MKDKIRNAFDELNPDELTEHQVFSKIKENSFKSRRSRFKFNKIALICSVLLVIVTGFTAYAYQNNKQEELTKITTDWNLSESMTPINISKQDGNHIFTAKSMIYDNRSAFILFSVKNKNGKPMKLKENKEGVVFGFDNVDLELSNEEEYNKSLLCLEPKDEKEYEFILVVDSVDVNTKVNFSGETININFNNLKKGNLDIFCRNNGEWNFNINIPKESTGEYYTLDQSFPYNSGKGKLTYIYLSPLRMDLTLTGAISEDLDFRLFNDEAKLSLELKNGERIPQKSIISYINSTVGTSEGDQAYGQGTSIESPTFSFLLWPFGQIDPEDFAAFYIDDIRIPLDLSSNINSSIS